MTALALRHEPEARAALAPAGAALALAAAAAPSPGAALAVVVQDVMPAESEQKRMAADVADDAALGAAVRRRLTA